MTDDGDFGERYWRIPSAAANPVPSSLDDAAFRQLADNIPTLCWLAEGDGSIIWYNRRWHDYCGTTPQQMEGWGWQSVHDPAVLPQVMANWIEAIGEGSPFEMTFPLRGADGRYRPFLTRIQPLRDDAGAVIRWFGVNTDVSKQVEAAEALEASEASLRALNDELRSANEEVQRFAYIVSHDLRAPLVNVLGFTSELEGLRGDLGTFLDDVARAAPGLVTNDLRTAVETDLPEALGFIRSSTQKMDRLINAILKLSREGRRRLAAEPIDLAALVGTQRDSLTQQLAARDGVIAVEGTLPPLVSDRLAVEQVLGNLLENAVKYLSPDRPGRITVTGGSRGGRVTIDVADNGRGIDERDVERVFELFRRSGVQDTAGEGIGLATVRNLARRLGGNVTLRSRFGEGSTFTVTLPAVLKAGA